MWFIYLEIFIISLLGWGVECIGYWFLMIWDFKC